MTDTTALYVGQALTEGVRLLTNVQKEKARYDYLSETSKHNRAARRPVCEEETLPGVELKNYTSRKQLDNGTHVKVIEHHEFLEKVPVPIAPPTPEEIAQEREEKRFVAKLWAGVASVAIVVVGTVVIVERTQARKPQVISV